MSDINDIFRGNLKGINKWSYEEKLYRYVQSLSLYLDDIHEIDEIVDDEKIKNIYYNSYFVIINSIKLFNTEYWPNLNESLKKAAESLEILSNLAGYWKLNSDELLFDSILTYSITNYYSRAYVLTKKNKDLNLPKYKEVIFQFMNRDLSNLRSNLLIMLNSENCNEKILIEKFKLGKINKIEALEFMLSYSIFKSLNNVLNYIYVGNDIFIEKSVDLLEKYGLIALNYGFVDFSWIIDILKIMIEEFYKNSLWNQLKPFNDADDFNPKLKQYILNYVSLKNPILELWPSQLEAMSEIMEDNNFTVKMPTSAGKTLVAELTILKYLIDTNFSGKIVYLSPFKSLSTELELKFKKSFGALGVNVSEFYGNFDFDPFGRKILDYYDLFILTPEKFDSILRAYGDFKKNIGLVIIDEGHIIGGNDKRGLKFELLINRVKKMFENSKLVFISGVLSNMDDFAKWLTGHEDRFVESNWKPSDVLVGTLTWTKKGSFIQYFNGELKNNLKFMGNIYDKNNSSMFPKNRNEALALSALKFANEGQTFIFSPVKNHIGSVANAIVTLNSKLSGELFNLKLKIDDDDEDINYLKELIVDELGPNDELLVYLNSGFLIHHGSLPVSIKLCIEDILRKDKIKLVIGTNTLAQGVNFPIKTVLIKSIYRIYPQKIDEETVNNLIGRAGRANENNNGRVLLVIDKIMNKNSNQRFEFKKLVRSNKRLESSLNSILQYFKEKFKDSEVNFEEFCLYLAEKTSDKNLKDLIDCLDLELFSFIEENKELEDSELLELIIKYSLYNAQFPDNTHELKILLNSRIQFLKNQYVKENRSKMYKLGFNLPDCITVENNYQYLNNLFGLLEKWDGLENELKISILYCIAIFFFEKKIFQSNMYYDKSFESFDKKILEYWINGLSNYEISKNMNIDTKIISSLINSFKNTLPWLITSTLIFLKDQNSKNGFKPLSDICEYVPTMFQYGIFDLKMAMLLYEFNDLKLCKKLIEFLNLDNGDTFYDLYFKIENLKFDFPFVIDESNSLIRNYSNQNNFSDEIFVKIHTSFLSDCNLNEGDLIIIKKENTNLLLFDIEGNFLKTVNDSSFEFDYSSFDKLLINNMWIVKINGEYYNLKRLN